ncbi:MAG: transglutaminase-like domain-containing protein [Dongiaceae bacterium]
MTVSTGGHATPSPRDYLRVIGAEPEQPIDVAEAALAFAAIDYPNEDLAVYREHLQLIGRDLQQLAQLEDITMDDPDATLAIRVDMLRNVLATRHGYRGDEASYDDLQNANLMRVIDRRRGLPVALSILYIHAARSQDWQIEGVNFPGHFMVRLRVGNRAAILDPFDQGATRSITDLREKLKSTAGEKAELRPDHSAAVSDRDILLRLQTNIKLRLVQEGELQRAADVVERMLWIAPDQAALWREAGLIQHRLGHLAGARFALLRFLTFDASANQRHQAARLLQEIERVLQ